MSRWLTKGHENTNRGTTFVILNLFQDLRCSRVRRSRNKFGMTDMMVRDDNGACGEAVFSSEPTLVIKMFNREQVK